MKDQKPLDPVKSLPRTALGSTGLQVSRLAYGTGTNGWAGRSAQSDLGVERLAGLLQRSYQMGVNFWDTADAYGTHPHIARALQQVPREKVVILTKTLSKTADGAKNDVDRYLKELKTDYIDVILLHVMTSSDWPRRYAGAMASLSQAQAQGKVRALGISSHGFGALEAAVDTNWCQVVMARINYAGVNMDASTEKVVPVLQDLHDAGKAMVGMKVLGNGRLSNDPRKAVDFALKLGTVQALTIGITSEGQLKENIKLVREISARYPISQQAAGNS